MTQQQLVEGARRQKVVIEYHDPGSWWVMHDDGQVEEWDTAQHAIGSVRRAARRRNTGLTLTTVEWRGVRDGWVPPQ